MIFLLDKNTIDKIAAGEVVERPSSVAKELIENAIDAKATAISVEIKDGGISFLRITDNGCGIEKDEVRKAFLRHATSKIRTISDLETITSLGFRGEALSSISAIARVELLTKPKADMVGTRYVIEGGAEKAFDSVGIPDGTTIIIKDIFFNTPARQKFLKTPQTEGSYISSLIEHMALSHPEISFSYKINGNIKLQTSGNGSLTDVLYQIYGMDIVRNIVEINKVKEGLSIRGYIGKPVISRGNRNYENYYVNGRFVKDKTINKAIEDGYKHYMMQHQFPFTLFFIEIESRSLDVNVHPAKAEVRFNDERGVYDFIREAIEETLAPKSFIPEIPLDKKEKFQTDVKQAPPELLPQTPPEKFAAEPFENTLLEKVKEMTQSAAEDHTVIKEPLHITEAAPVTSPEITNTKNNAWDVSPKERPKAAEFVQESFITKETEKHYFKLIGQVFDTYWIMEYNKKMYIVDQHAAHEKVNYERFVKRFQSKTFSSQRIMPPIIITLSPEEEELVTSFKSLFEMYGFEIDYFGGKEYSLSSVPTDLYGMNEKEFFHSLVDEFSGSVRIEPEPDMFLHKIATAACKASVKGHDRLSFAEAEELLKELFNAKAPYHCPHGRPTMISLSVGEIEKMFKRIV